MITLYDHIQQLRLELSMSVSHDERAEITVQLSRAMADQAALDRDLDHTIEALIGEAC